MSARWARTARGWSVALLAGVLSAALHASAGGSFPAPAVVLLAVLLSGLVSTALVGGAPSVPRLAATVAAGQITFHTVFTVFGDTGAVTLSAAGHATHAGSAALIADPASAHAAAGHTGLGMLLAHLLAGAISTILLAHGEGALRELRRIAVLTVLRLSRAPEPRPVPRRRAVPIDLSVAAPTARSVLGALRYRGPPAVLRAA